jgi:ABC-2 type transport system ATP-binding protein
MTMDTAMPPPARAATGAAPAIEAHDLVKTYPKGVKALDGLSFAVPAGTVFGLLGPNGAGKSTTVKILTTLAQADSGTARVAGLDVRAKPARVRHLIGVVAQLSGADPVATGRENVMLSGRIQGLRGRDLARRTHDLLGRFGLADAAGRRVRTYSGGMRPSARRGDGPGQPAAGAVPRQAPRLDQVRSAMWAEIGRLATEGPDHPAHHPPTWRKRTTWPAPGDRGPRPGGGRGHADELKGELHGDAVHLEQPMTRPGIPCSPRWRAFPASARRGSGASLSPALKAQPPLAGRARRAGGCRDHRPGRHRRPPIAR